MRILVCEDTKDLNRLIVKTLDKNGYVVDFCFDGESALDYAVGAEYDAIVLDIMMPKKDGYTVLKELRDSGNKTPVLFLTAKDTIEDRVKGLDLGADDYLIKPFDFEELLARIRVMTRRAAGVSSTTYILEDLEVNPQKRTVKRGGHDIPLISKEYALLEYMIRNQGIVLSIEQLENAIWNYEEGGSSNNIAVYISRLRKKIDANYKIKLFHTIRGVGYCLRREE